MTSVEPFRSLDAATTVIESVPVPDDLRLEGRPHAGSVDVAAVAGATVGIWEMTAGSMRDIEEDEVFVVVSGEATVELVDEDGRIERTMALRPGSLCRLEAGMRTQWHVPTVLRKVYVIGDAEPKR